MLNRFRSRLGRVTLPPSRLRPQDEAYAAAPAPQVSEPAPEARGPHADVTWVVRGLGVGLTTRLDPPPSRQAGTDVIAALVAERHSVDAASVDVRGVVFA